MKLTTLAFGATRNLGWMLPALVRNTSIPYPVLVGKPKEFNAPIPPA